MADLKELLDIEDLNAVWEVSREKPVLLFKQSTTFPISAEAFSQFHTFLEADDSNAEAYFVKVRETRSVSNEIAEELGVRHQSSQLFLVKDKQSVWNASHDKVTVGTITEALKDAE